MALICSELSSDSNYSQSFTVSYKNGALARSYKYGTILAVVNVDVSCDIEDEIKAIFTVIDVVLLFFDRIDFFYFE